MNCQQSIAMFLFIFFTVTDSIEKKDYSCMEFNLQFCMLKLVWFCFFGKNSWNISHLSVWSCYRISSNPKRLSQLSRNRYWTNIFEIFNDDREKIAITRQKWGKICNFQEKIDRPIWQVFFWVYGPNFLSKPAFFLGTNEPYHLGFLF